MEPIKKRKPIFVEIKDIDPGKRVNTYVLVKSLKVVFEKLRYDGSKIRVAECVAGDETGCINFVAKNEQLDTVKEGTSLILRNAHANVVRGHIQLEVDRWGKIEVYDKGVKSVNTENDLSATEYELVTVRK